MVFDEPIRKIVLKYKPSCNVLHDQWLYVLSNIFGHVIYDDRPFMFYRIHQNNAAGIPKGGLLRKIFYLFRGNKKRNVGAAELAENVLKQCDEILNKNQKKVLNLIANSSKSYVARLRMFLSSEFFVPDSSLRRKVYYKLKILLGRI